MVRYEKNIVQFPQPSPGQTQVNVDEPMIIFSLGDQRFAVQFTVAEVKGKPAKVVPIREIRRRKRGERQDRSQ